jgi:hypothetical protein
MITSTKTSGGTSAPGWQTTEFALSAVSLAATALGVKSGLVAVDAAMEFAAWVIGAYCGARGLSKLGADEGAGSGKALAGMVRNTLAKPATLAQAAAAGEVLGPSSPPPHVRRGRPAKVMPE